MPAIRGQTILPDGFELDTTDWGKRRVQFEELGGNDVRLTIYVDDVQTAQETLNNPSLTELYVWVGTWMFPGSVLSVDGKTMAVDRQLFGYDQDGVPIYTANVYVSWHLIQRNPLQLTLLSSNSMPPSNWWQ